MKFNKTHLSLELAEERYIQHRDYLAHCLRWSHALKYAVKQRKEGLRVWDIGCGKEVPFLKALYSNKMSPEIYHGSDVNKLELPEMLKGAFDKGKFKVVLATEDSAVAKLSFKPNLVICYEVLEHMPFTHVSKVLQNVCSQLPDDGIFLMSTPCFNGDAAGNHPNEMTYEVMGSLIEEAGFAIPEHYGTFASITDYKECLIVEYGEVGLSIFNNLRNYYDSNVLAVIFAPLFPAQSRNCLWHCTKAGNGYVRQFRQLSEIPKPWGNDPNVQ